MVRCSPILICVITTLIIAAVAIGLYLGDVIPGLESPIVSHSSGPQKWEIEFNIQYTAGDNPNTWEESLSENLFGETYDVQVTSITPKDSHAVIHFNVNPPLAIQHVEELASSIDIAFGGLVLRITVDGKHILNSIDRDPGDPVVTVTPSPMTTSSPTPGITTEPPIWRRIYADNGQLPLHREEHSCFGSGGSTAVRTIRHEQSYNVPNVPALYSIYEYYGECKKICDEYNCNVMQLLVHKDGINADYGSKVCKVFYNAQNEDDITCTPTVDTSNIVSFMVYVHEEQVVINTPTARPTAVIPRSDHDFKYFPDLPPETTDRVIKDPTKCKTYVSATYRSKSDALPFMVNCRKQFYAILASYQPGAGYDPFGFGDVQPLDTASTLSHYVIAQIQNEPSNEYYSHRCTRCPYNVTNWSTNSSHEFTTYVDTFPRFPISPPTLILVYDAFDQSNPFTQTNTNESYTGTNIDSYKPPYGTTYEEAVTKCTERCLLQSDICQTLELIHYEDNSYMCKIFSD